MAHPLRIRYSALGIQPKLLLPVIAFCVCFGILILSSLWLYLDRLGQQQSDKLGQHLSRALADQARQPLLYKDSISLQVLVNKFVNDSPEVLRAGIFDINDKLQTQSDSRLNLEDHDFSLYTHHITVEHSTIGYTRLWLGSENIKWPLQALFWVALLVWLLSSSLLCLGLSVMGRKLSRRLTRIVMGLPVRLHTENDDEISRLETHIKPLLVKPSIDQNDDHSNDQSQDKTSLTLTICCENIQRLAAQLTQKSYHDLLIKLDTISNTTAKLYAAQRLTGSQHCLHLRFDCEGNQLNALIRAVSCYTAISEILKRITPRSGTGLILCAALGHTEAADLRLVNSAQDQKEMGDAKTPPPDSQIIQDQQRELVIERLIKTTALADPWQLLIEAELVTTEAINTDSNPGDTPSDTTGSIINYEPLPNADGQVLFDCLGADYQIVLTRQLDYLYSQLPSGLFPRAQLPQAKPSSDGQQTSLTANPLNEVAS